MNVEKLKHKLDLLKIRRDNANDDKCTYFSGYLDGKIAIIEEILDSSEPEINKYESMAFKCASWNSGKTTLL